jgi:hypothetical protein
MRPVMRRLRLSLGLGPGAALVPNFDAQTIATADLGADSEMAARFA